MPLIIKIVPGKYMNADAVANVIRYIYAGAMQLPEQERLYGCMGFPEDSDPEAVILGMMLTKRIFEAEDGVQCKHLIVSFGKKPPFTRKKLRKLMIRIAGFWKKKCQVYWGVHHIKEEDKENFHLHIMLNSVNMKNGRRININRKLRRKFEKNANRTWANAIKESG